jgi:hypothetical protein
MSASDKLTMTHGEFTDLFCSSMANIGAQSAGKALDLFADMLDAGEIRGGLPLDQVVVKLTVEKISKAAREMAENFRSGTLGQMTPESFRELAGGK